MGSRGVFIKQNEELLSEMKNFGAFRSRPSLGESPKPWIFFVFIENPIKINDLLENHLKYALFRKLAKTLPAFLGGF